MKRIIIYTLVMLSVTSCKVFNPSQMLRPGKDFRYTKFSTIPLHDEYRIASYDILTFTVLPNNGERLLTAISTGNQGIQNIYNNQSGFYKVERDGKVKFPVFGRIQIAGMTIKDAEKMLEDKLSAYVIEPFVQLRVTNKRVLIFNNFGTGTGTKVIQLENDNTTLFEVLAQSGGLNGGKAYKIKLIRGDLTNPQIYLIDLSTINGVIKSDLVLQANDIIYIENPLRLHQRIITELTPYLTFISFLLVLYNFKTVIK